MNEIKKVLFIVNKFAGGDYKKAVEGRILRACEQRDIECIIEHTRQRGHAYDLANAAARSGIDRVFAVGGDGTVNETAQALAGGNIPMGILPKGSGNGLARHLGIPLSLTNALQLVDSHRVIRMDSFRINGHLSVNVSGIGFDAHVASLFGKNGQRGFANYAKLTLREFHRYPEHEVDMVTDGKHQAAKAFVVAIANSSQFGNNARIAPRASVTDGLLDISCIRKVPAAGLPAFAWRMFTGSLGPSKYVSMQVAKRIEITASQKLAYHVDGEPMGSDDRFLIEVHPASVGIILPDAVRNA